MRCFNIEGEHKKIKSEMWPTDVALKSNGALLYNDSVQGMEWQKREDH